jgi:hypothetical protein
MEREAVGIIDSVLSTKYPEFNSRFSDLIRKILDKVLILKCSTERILNLIWIHF